MKKSRTWSYIPYLFAHRPDDDHVLEQLFVLGPYPTRDFFSIVTDLARPSRMVLAVDESWPESNIDRIRRVGEDALTVWRVYAAGMVHAKLYWMRWSHPQTGSRRDVLAYGSGNASKPGFGANAETLASIDLSTLPADERTKVRAWLDALAAGTSVTRVRINLRADGRSTLLLPTVKVRKKYRGNFTSWLLAGRLCHQWAPDAEFGRLPLRLTTPLPPGEEEAIFEKSGLSRAGERGQLAFRYVAQDTSKISGTQWKSQFFVDTQLGHWTSYECFSDLSDVFVARGKESRGKILDDVATASPAQQRAWVDAFMSRVAGARKLLRDRGFDPNDYLSPATMDPSRLRARAHRIVNMHIARARQTEFRSRFTARFVFPRMPRFAEDRRATREFQLSFAESILVARERKARLRLLSALDSFDEEELLSPEALVAAVNNRWSSIEGVWSGFHRQ